ncbi:transcription factor [Corynebacterium maris DSM 45190]|uniref:Transcription factor n=1 Tax=Corynebacterium maris DSM 45190 TaxID=1224163 RepID=S5T248_9CORY|nr:MarR family transcriptional regulator [Corynebacterium maris]AGS34670.1 transcription factor [Corynebacterium maris DSM 45190]
MTEDHTQWLSAEEQRTWLAVWSVTEWLPTRLDEQLKRDSGVNLHDYFALAQISMAPDERLTMTDLAALSDMSPSRLSHVVARLERRGWVVRSPSETDRRTNIASLTDEGRTFIREAAPGHVTRARELVFDPLTKDEVESLGTILNKILTALDPPLLPRT